MIINRKGKIEVSWLCSPEADSILQIAPLLSYVLIFVFEKEDGKITVCAHVFVLVSRDCPPYSLWSWQIPQ